ncbi:hypothetical protein AB670_00017 [Chryseobacterium sp. MOF25P]|uniref:hypothetical protein n=1 Tax=unclassified Chryseobacterium TaxID=2593645 RepID=UPI000805AC7C|nr:MULTISPECIES: hypothetical protein [unclassified Chryseobacterium]OBW43488.1 hypothetical protein AB670_00017 [Chryseobacterium sp. MOF25P]OBW46738.1 hypothetical protein AB671_01234 [Chryseobacterium sp. BGARF1]
MAWTFGVKKILSGDKAVDGGMGTVLTEHDEHLKGTVVLETTDETINWVETEEKGKRLALSQNDAETTLTFEIANPSLATMAFYLGGTVEEVGGKDTYSPPAVKDIIEKSVTLETKVGYDIDIPNGKVMATPLGGTVGTDGVMTMKVVITVQAPEKAGVEGITFREK